jgi:exonuclease SbcD
MSGHETTISPNPDDMSTIRLLHIADIHIGMENYGRLDPATGLHSRILDFLRRMSEALDHALQSEVDLVIFAGDAYKNRDPSSTFRREFARRIKKVADAGIPVVMVVGNHDLPVAERRASSIDIFRTLEVPNVIVASREEVHYIETRHGPVQVATVPYPLRSRLLTHDEFKDLSIEELNNALRDIITDNVKALATQVMERPDVPAILAAHLAVAEAEQGSEQRVMVGDDIIILKSTIANPAFDYVALGHIHKFQDVNRDAHPPVVYSGSLERIDFGEEKEPKGFVVAEVSRGQATYRFQRVAARPFLTIRLDVSGVDDPMRAIMEEIAAHDRPDTASLGDSVVRLLITLDESQERLIDERAIRRALAGAYYVAAISKDVRRAYRQRLGGHAVEELTPRQLLELYLDARGAAPERKELLLRYGDTILAARGGD